MSRCLKIIDPCIKSVSDALKPPFLRMATTLLAKSNSPPSIRMEMNGEVPRVLLAKTYRCLPKLRTKSTRTCTSRMVLLASDGFLRPTCTTGLPICPKITSGGSQGNAFPPHETLSCGEIRQKTVFTKKVGVCLDSVLRYGV